MKRTSPTSRVVIALRDRDTEVIVSFIRDWFFVEPTTEDVTKWCWMFKASKCWNWSDGTAGMWLKNRLDFAGYFKPFVGSGTTEVRVSCEMHCFFMHIEETESMIARLRNEKHDVAQPKRSRITASNLATITPINRIAANVVNGEDCR